MFNSLRSVSDQHLLSAADTIAVQDRKLTLKLLAHLHEIERRKLYSKLGYSSMFDYCTTRLHFSEPAAARRLRTARCLARFPQLGALLEAGEVNLSTVSMVAKLMTPATVDIILSRIRGKSRREVERLIAEYEPRMALPVDRVRAVVVPVGASRGFTVAGDSEKAPTCDAVPPPATPEHDLERRSVIQFTAREEFMAKVERVRTLVWHQLPGASFEKLFELALDELIARRDPAARQKRREQRRPIVLPSSAEGSKRYVRAAVRDHVFARDGFRCTYVAADGRRCSATVALQVDHIRPIARGGASTTDNLRILCAQHNRLEGERLMGRSVPPG
jgi:5-methylcytosine-specific restriction endonuclease McrA